MSEVSLMFFDRASLGSGVVRLTTSLLLVVALSLLSLAVNAQGVPKKEFPRLGGYQIGKTPFDGYGDPAYQRELARLDLVILGGATRDMTEHAAAIRRLNPTILLAKYTKLQSIWTKFGGYWEIKRNKVFGEKGPNTTNAFDWWARDYQGNQLSHWPGNWTVNITRYVKPDSSGDRFPEWAAKLDYDWWLQHDPWDAVYEDAVHWRPRRSASGESIDWSGGKERDTAKIHSEFRLGHQAYWNQFKELAPGKLILVNHDWYLSENPIGGQGRWDLPEFDKQVHGGLLELIMKSSDLKLDEPKTPWIKKLTYYQRSMSYFRDPNVTMFVVHGEPDNYRFLRYSFATCLLDDGYFDYAPLEYIYGTVEWFDEFDLAGTATTSWLGLALDSPPTAAWKDGVWRRDFEGGVALVNPQGNGVVTVTIESGFRHIAGRQDPIVNNGRPASAITLQDGDGIILVREETAAAPAPPEPPLLRAE